ncbi:unnamed protein product [Calypogeia fissa]
MMEGIAIPTGVPLISLQRHATLSSFAKSAKSAKSRQSPTLGLQLGRSAPGCFPSRVNAHLEKYKEGETAAASADELPILGRRAPAECPKVSTDGGWESMMCQLRSRALRSTSPEISLREGHWMKLICGASFEDLAEVRNLSLVYTLAGVDCIDCAADTAVVAAVVEGVNAAKDLMKDVEIRRPWIMISVNDDVDPHFRKAEFDSALCPSDCPRPCESVCPALAIKFQTPNGDPKLNPSPLEGGVVMERCYGCGRCLSVCPLGLISARTYVRPLEAVANLIMTTEVDAIEIHTGAGHAEVFEGLVSKLGNTLLSLKLVAVSVPDLGEAMIPAMTAMYASMQPFLKHLNLWQLDGRPMSGDIGAGATWAAVAVAARVVVSADRPKGYLQLAGGTNAHTVTSMKEHGLCGPSTPLTTDCNRLTDTFAGSTVIEGLSIGEALISGVAFGGYARKVVSKFFQKMHDNHKEHDSLSMDHGRLLLEHYPSLMIGAVQEAIALVDTVKPVREV